MKLKLVFSCGASLVLGCLGSTSLLRFSPPGAPEPTGEDTWGWEVLIKGKLGLPWAWRQGVPWNRAAAAGSGAHQVPNGKKHMEPAPPSSASELPPHAREKAELGVSRRPGAPRSLASLHPCCSPPGTRLDGLPSIIQTARRPFVLGTRRSGEKPARRPGILWPSAELGAPDKRRLWVQPGDRDSLALHVRFLTPLRAD